MLPTISINSKMIFPEDQYLSNLNCKMMKLQKPLKRNSNVSGMIWKTKLIKMDRETDQNLLPITSRPYMLPLKHQEWVQ